MSSRGRKGRGEFVAYIGSGFAAKERPHVRDVLSALRPHLERWNTDDVSVEVSLQDRGRREQRVTLRTVLPGLPPLVAVVADANLAVALAQATDEVIRQLGSQTVAREAVHDGWLSGRIVRYSSGLRPFNGSVD